MSSVIENILRVWGEVDSSDVVQSIRRPVAGREVVVRRRRNKVLVQPTRVASTILSNGQAGGGASDDAQLSS